MEFENALIINAVAAVERAEILEEKRRRVKPRTLDPLNTISEEEFIKNFRLSKELFQNLSAELDPFLLPPSRQSATPKETKILSALNLLGTGSFQNDIGNSSLVGLSTFKVSQSLHEVVDALNQPTILNKWIKFPNSMRELNALRAGFFERYHIPGVVGCIDCTHVAIHPPATNDPIYPEYIYVNRKGYHSLNVQLICDYNLKILSVNAKYPGSTNDKFVWNQSNVNDFFTRLYDRNHTGYYLLGDSGYALRPWLMTPYRDPEPQSREERYNIAHRTCRCLIEQCNGVLKSRFRCLCRERTLHYHPQFASRMVNACCVLHNMCIEHRVEAPANNYQEDLLGDNVEDVHVQRVNPLLAEAQRLQQNIVNTYF